MNGMHQPLARNKLAIWTQIFLGLILFVGLSPARALSQVKIWEYSPYEIGVWYTFEPSANISDFAKQQLLSNVQQSLDRVYRATWNTQFTELSLELSALVSRDFDEFTVEQLIENELVLVVSLKHEDSKTIRTMQAATETLSEVHVSADSLSRMNASAQRAELDAEDLSSKLIALCKVEDQGSEQIKKQLLAAEIPAAILPRAEVADVREEVRPILTTFPWQSDSVFRKLDKLFFFSIGRDGEDYVMRVRELDCPMQFLGPSFETTTVDWEHASRQASFAFQRAFAPIARVEEAEARSAKLRLRAGGLIVSKENPSIITVGDVLQPIVRRDDRNGIPTLLEPLSFTFAAITETDGVKMNSNVYTYSGGPGLQGRKNRRTRRVLLRVRPRYDESDVKIVVRGNESNFQSGCFIYERDLLTEEFELLGRTDWRGQFTIDVPDQSGRFLPEAIRKERFIAKREAAAKKAAEEKAAKEAAEKRRTGEGEDEATETEEQPAKEPAAAEVAEEEPIDPEDDKDALPLNFPLKQIYVKSGDSVLAKLPMVPGLKMVEVAKLPDDRARLRAEAFVRGFQGEILDLIGVRNLLAAQVQIHIKERNFEKANEALTQLREAKKYTDMATELERIERSMLDDSGGEISFSSKRKIDRMFQTTRDMLEKYLQDNLLADTEKLVADASGS